MTIYNFTAYNIKRSYWFKAVIALCLTLLLGGLLAVASQAQEDSQQPVLFINQVDSSGFPKVAINVSASGTDGYPLVGLSSADFLIFENDAEVQAGNVAAQADVAQELRLVIGFDLSTPPNALEDMKNAAIGLIETLGPRDRVALLTFHDQVNQLYPFTNNLNELRWAINTMTSQGSSTELNAVFAEAITLLSSQPSGRKAAIMLTDRLDTGSSISSEALITQAQAAPVPLYPVGFGAGVQGDALPQLGRSTGGLGVALPGSKDLAGFLQTLAVILPQSYTLTYQSGLPADDQSHNLSVNVVKQEVVSRPATADFVAQSSPVNVALTGVSEGDTVQGTVMLNAQVTAAQAPIASVEYFLNDQSLALLTGPPYRFEWDATGLTPGAYTIGLTVMDEAGNRGLTDTMVNVIPAELIVTANTSSAEITVGDTIAIEAQVEPLADTARVDLWFDDVVIASDDTAPYTFTVDTARYAAGAHDFTVQAIGTANQTGQTGFKVLFIAVPQLTTLGKQMGYRGDMNNDWFKVLVRALIIFTGIALIITIVFVTINLIKRVVRALTRVQPQKRKLKITNTGNISSRFEIRAEESTGFLAISFASSNGVRLQQPPPVDMIDAMPPHYNVGTATAGVAVGAAGSIAQRPIVAAGPPAAAKQPPQAASGGSGIKVGDAVNKAKGASKATQGIADILGTVGSLLPGGAGDALRNMAQQMRDASTKASMAAAQPGQMMSAAKSAQSKAGKMAPQMPKGVALPPAAKPAAAIPSPANQKSAAIPAVAATAAPVSMSKPTGPAVMPQPQPLTTSQPLTAPHQAFREWVQTPFVEPGQMIIFDVTMTPARNNETKDCQVKLISKPIEQPKIVPTVDEENIHIKALSFFRRVLLPVFLSLLMMVVAILLIVFVAYFTITTDSIARPFIWG